MRFLCVCVMLLVSNAKAESVRYFELEGFGNFLDGNPDTTAVSEDGTILLAPSVRDWFVDPELTFSAVVLWGDEVIAARADDQRVIAINSAGKVRELFKAEGTLVTAMLVFKNALYVAVSSDKAKIYRLEHNQKTPQLFYTAQAKFIWSLILGPKDKMYLATGQPGNVLSLTTEGKDQKLFSPEQQHLRSLAYHPKLGLFVGGAERGILYRATSENNFKALYDSNYNEIAAIAVDDNAAYIAAVSGAEALENKKNKTNNQVRSELAAVTMDGTAETMAGSDDEIILGLALKPGDGVWVTTSSVGKNNPRGRLYRVMPQSRKITLLYQSKSRQLNEILLQDKKVLVVGSGGARITELGSLAASGEFFTSAFDTGIASQFGALHIFANLKEGTRVTAAVRTGQTSEPDATWSEWSDEIENLTGDSRALNNRYVQIRLKLYGKGNVSPEVYRLRLAYLRYNVAPFVREVTALEKGYALQSIPKEESKTKNISLNVKEERKNTETTSTRSDRAKQTEKRGALSIKWVAEDPNGDDMLYDLYVRPLMRKEWQLLATELEDPFYTFQTSQLPEGYYQFRVVATDKPSNPLGLEKSDERESQSVLIDNTPPVLSKPSVNVSGQSVSVKLSAKDSTSLIKHLLFSLDGQATRALLPVDGILDGLNENIQLNLENLKKGQHTVTFYVQDEAENEAFAEAVFEVK